MPFEYTFETDPAQKTKLCERILTSLPLWFGIPEANQDYAEGVRELPFLKANQNGRTIGFVSLKSNSPYCLEIYVMGIEPDYHRQGIGKALLERTMAYAKSEGYRYLEVKTLDESRESEEYRKTRLFYHRVGFLPIDVLTNEWGPENPCLIMIMGVS